MDDETVYVTPDKSTELVEDSSGAPRWTVRRAPIDVVTVDAPSGFMGEVGEGSTVDVQPQDDAFYGSQNVKSPPGIGSYLVDVIEDYQGGDLDHLDRRSLLAIGGVLELIDSMIAGNSIPDDTWARICDIAGAACDAGS